MITGKQLFLAVLLVLSGMQNHAMEENAAVPKSPSVSLIYYPSVGVLLPGHVELEVEGLSWTLVPAFNRSKLLADMIEHSTKDGKPFFRFVLEANSEQMQTIQKSMSTKISKITCGRGALYPLEQANVCSVPSPLNLSPLLTAAYLMGAKKLGRNNVVNVEYYGNPSLKESVMKMLPGTIYEIMLIGYVPIAAWYMKKIAASLQHQSKQSEEEL
jgi:hypothetical protein